MLAINGITLVALDAARLGPPSSGKQRVLIALDARDGEPLWKASPGRDEGSSLSTWFATAERVIASEATCFSEERPYRRDDRSIVSFSADTGEEEWRIADVVPLDSYSGLITWPSPRGQSAVVPVLRAREARAFARSGKPPSHVDGVNTETGRRVWQRHLDDNVMPWAFDRSTLIVGTAPRFAVSEFATEIRVQAIDLQNGRVRWSSSLGVARSIGAVAVGGHAVAIHFDQSYDATHPDLARVVSLDPSDGHTLADLAPVAWNAMEGVGDQILGSDDGGSQAASSRTGQVAWSADGQLVGAPAPDVTPVMLGGFDDGVLRALDTTTGSERWRFPVDHGFHGVVRTGDVMAIGANRVLSGVDARTGALTWKRALRTNASQFVAGGGKVVLSGGCPTTTAD